MQHYCRDGVDPPQQRGRIAIPNQQVGFCSGENRAEVISPEREGAVSRGEEESLFCTHGVTSWQFCLLERVEVAFISRLLKPDARLRKDIGTERDVRVDTQRSLVLDVIAHGVALTVVHFGFGSYGDMLVRGTEEVRARRREEGRMRKHNGDGNVEVV